VVAGIDATVCGPGVNVGTLSSAVIETLDRDGFGIFPSLLDDTKIEALRLRIEELEREEDASGAGTNPDDPGAVRVENLNHKGSAFDELWVHPILLAVLHHLLVDFRLGSMTSRSPRPRMGHQQLHRDGPRVFGGDLGGPFACPTLGPRYNAFVVARRDLAVFSLGTRSDDAKGRQRAEDLAGRLKALLDGTRMSYGEAGRALGVRPNSLRYEAQTGTVLMRWEGSRQPTIWSVPPPETDPGDTRLELARRFLHIYGPATPAFGRWAGIGLRPSVAVFEALRRSLTPARTPVGDAWILARDEPTFRAAPRPAAPARLLPSGDAYPLLHGTDRDILVSNAARRGALWTPRVWPGGILVDGEIVGTWRRADAVLTLQPWRQLSPAERDAVASEAGALPIPGVGGRITVRWDD
jgi:hypothetical protein